MAAFEDARLSMPSAWAFVLGVAAGALPVVLRPPYVLAAMIGLFFVPLLLYAFSVPGRWMILFFGTLILLPPFPVGEANVHPSIVLGGLGVLAGIVSARRSPLRQMPPFGPVN